MPRVHTLGILCCLGGGENNVNFEFSPYLPNATVAVDGRPLIQEGKLS
jgi:hypothetical protein